MNLDVVRNEMILSKPYFKHFSPSWPALAKGRLGKVLKRAFITLTVSKEAYAVAEEGKKVEEVAGGIVGGMVLRNFTKYPRRKVLEAHRHVRFVPKRDLWRKNGLGGRYWIYQPGRHKMVIVFHDANRAGPHIDVHIGRFSLIRRVKPEIYEQLRYNSDGYLTQNSRKLLIDFLKEEIDNNTRTPQNLDHTVRNARASWVGGDREGESYGDGPTRQVIAEEDVEVYKANPDGPIELYAPLLNSRRGMYIYKIYEGNGNRVPIMIWGNLKSGPPPLQERLHLNFIQPEEIDSKMVPRSDIETSTAKYDGSSCYVVITPKGTTVWSPRESKATGEQIEYTFKLGNIANTTSEEVIVGMGELMFRKPHDWLPFIYNRGEYIPQAEGSGILNSNRVAPKHLRPEIRLYRIDRIGRTNVSNLDFWSNRGLQHRAALLNPDIIKVVELMTPDEAKLKGFEGVVMGRRDDSVNDFLKTKWWQDEPNDWKVTSVDLHPGPRGGIAGVVWFKSLDSGRIYKLGPGQLGDHEFNMKMMENPDLYVDSVFEVRSRKGHEGRASKVNRIHPDKGTAPF